MDARDGHPSARPVNLKHPLISINFNKLNELHICHNFRHLIDIIKIGSSWIPGRPRNNIYQYVRAVLANWPLPGSAGILPAYCRKIKRLPIFDGACEERAGCPRSQDAMANHLFLQQTPPPRNPGRAFYDWIESLQQAAFGPSLTRLIQMIQVAQFGKIDPEISFRFEPLWSLDEAEQVNARKVEVETDIKLVKAGIITAQEARARLAAQPESPYAALDLTIKLHEPLKPAAEDQNDDLAVDGIWNEQQHPRDCTGKFVCAGSEELEQLAALMPAEIDQNTRTQKQNLAETTTHPTTEIKTTLRKHADEEQDAADKLKEQADQAKKDSIDAHNEAHNAKEFADKIKKDKTISYGEKIRANLDAHKERENADNAKEKADRLEADARIKQKEANEAAQEASEEESSRTKFLANLTAKIAARPPASPENGQLLNPKPFDQLPSYRERYLFNKRTQVRRDMSSELDEFNKYVNNIPGLSDRDKYILDEIFIGEGGYEIDKDGKVYAGIGGTALEEMKKKNKTKGINIAGLSNINLSADLEKHKDIHAQLCYVYLDQYLLHEIGGMHALEEIKDAHSAAAYADTFFAHGDAGAMIIKDAVNAVLEHLKLTPLPENGSRLTTFEAFKILSNNGYGQQLRSELYNGRKKSHDAKKMEELRLKHFDKFDNK